MKSLACVAAVLCAAPAFAASITVEAGGYDRRDCAVEFKLPPGNFNTLVDAKGGMILLQVNEERAAFVVPELKRGENRTWTLQSNTIVAVPRVLAETSGNKVELFMGTKWVLTFRTGKTELPPNRPDLNPIFRRGGYIHPVLSPSGKQITDDYPSNHKHHHGIWFAWTHTEFEGRKPDFWNMGDGKGTVEFVSVDKAWEGSVHAGFTSKLRQVDLTDKDAGPKTALNESWVVKLYAVGEKAARPYYLFDMDITDTCAAGPVKLPKYRYGGIGVRGNWAWNGKDKLNFLNSEGMTDRTKGDENQTVGRWAHMGGELDGGVSGIAVLGHPSNVRAPQPQRIHPTEPFLNFAPQQAGDVEITPEKPLTLRYRFVVADGAPDKAELDRLWNDYAFPPIVTVTDK